MGRPLIDRAQSILELSGGLGLFLVGMIVMTDGLHAAAGDTMRKALRRFTRNPVSGALTGAISTVILQSSSATTVAAVGFVGAGLMRFHEALGIVLGANVGTTIKGWVIAIVGFKLDLGEIFLPLILAGAAIRLFARGRVASLAFAAAGFGIIFVGIDFMQMATEGFQDTVTPDKLPGDTLTGRVLLVGIGIVFTVITQSSSAGVAMAITAISVGAISFQQGAALVIGMDVGTTVTAALATLGKSIDARRTGLSHVIYNILTAIGAFFFLAPFTWSLNTFLPGQIEANPELALVGFHTTFNTLGVALILPFTKPFARFIEWTIRDRSDSSFGKTLDDSLLQQPDLAMRGVQENTIAELEALLCHLNALLGDKESGKRIDMNRLELALEDTRDFADHIEFPATAQHRWRRLANLIHAIDHLDRLQERCESVLLAEISRKSAYLSTHASERVEINRRLLKCYRENHWSEAATIANAAADALHSKEADLREAIVHDIAEGDIDMEPGRNELDALRWLCRTGKHIARITHHLEQSALAAATEIPEI